MAISPNMAYAPGMNVKVLSPMVMRVEEDLNSAELRHLAENEICSVVAIGIGETGRRLLVAQADGSEGWISCTSQSGKQLISQAPQGLPQPPSASSPPPSLPPPSMQPPIGIVAPPAPPPAPLMGLPEEEQEPRLNECFMVGDEIRAIDKMILRESEDLQSNDLCELKIGTEMVVHQIGSGPTGRRLMVMADTGQIGWISCFSQSGNKLVDSVPRRFTQKEPARADSAVLPSASAMSAPAPIELAPAPIAPAPEFVALATDFAAPVTELAPAPLALARPNVAYPVGSHIITMDPARMRAEEDLRSSEVMELPAGTELTIIAHGIGEDGRRIFVHMERTGARGWISCCSASGKALIQFAVQASEVTGWVAQAQQLRESIQSQQAEAPPSGVARNSGNGFDLPPGYENGQWHYVCVDPNGVRLRDIAEYAKKNKTGQELVYGEMVTINFRGKEDKIFWLALADCRGFAMEKTNRRRMSEVKYEPILPDRRTFIIHPQLTSSMPLARTPVILGAASSKSCHQVVPGMLVQKRRSATVILQAANDRYKEVPTVFVEVFDPAGNVGWIPERTANGEEVLVEPARELLPPPMNWITVLNTSNAKTTTCPGNPVAEWERLSPGQFLEVSEVLTVNNSRYFKLAAADQWVCEAPLEERGKPVVELVVLEQHWWAYVCDDKTGAGIRDTPTRVKSTKTGQLLKHRQRVIATDIAIMQNGEEYIHLGPPFAGWVPTTKVNGTQKMQALNPVPATKGSWAGGKYPIQKTPPLPEKGRQQLVWTGVAKAKAKQAVKSQSAPVPCPQQLVHRPKEIVTYGDGRVSQNDGDFNAPLPIRRSLGGTQQDSAGFVAAAGYPGITAVQLGGVQAMPRNSAPPPSHFWPARH